MHKAADRIRNVAIVGHRGSGKTSLHEALLFQAGAVNRLGTVVDGTTSSDTDPDEKSRQMSISLALSSFEWQERKVNLVDTPGDSSFIADALGALRVCDSASKCTRTACGGGRPSWIWRGCCTSTCWTASAPTSFARSSR
jgi:elongation factor G